MNRAAIESIDMSAQVRSAATGRSRGPILGWIHVARRARRAGVGRQLVTTAEEWARVRGLTTVEVRSTVTREEAHRLYPALDYRLGKTQRKYVKEFVTPLSAEVVVCDKADGGAGPRQDNQLRPA